MADEPASPFTNVTPSEAATGTEKFLGQKERRRSSGTKPFLGDYQNLIGNQSIVKTLAKFGDQRIVFSDIVIKINKRNKMQERILLITEAAVYNIDPGNFKVKRRIPIASIGGVKLSKLPDNFFCLHVPSEYDYLLVSSRKTEIVTNIIQYFEAATKSKLPVSFSNSFDYKIDQDMYREIQFSSAEGGVSTQIFTKKMDSKKK